MNMNVDESALSAALSAALQMRDTADGSRQMERPDLRFAMEIALKQQGDAYDRVARQIWVAMLDEILIHRFAGKRVIDVPAEAFGPITEAGIRRVLGPRSIEAMQLLREVCEMALFPEEA